MYTPLKLGIYLLGTVLLLGILSPLIIFTCESLTRTDFLVFNIKSVEVIDKEQYYLTISLKYNGTVTLYNVKVIIGNKTILRIPKLEGGKEYIATLFFTEQDFIAASKGYTLRLNIGGLYDFEYSVEKDEVK